MKRFANFNFLKVLPLIVLLTACMGPSKEEIKVQSKERKVQREAKDETLLTRPVAHRSHQIQGHELITFAVPYRSTYGQLETQQCFVWRDAEFKTSSIQCVAPPELNFSE